MKFGNTLLLGYYWVVANKKRILAIIWGLTLLLAIIIQSAITFTSFTTFITTYGYNAPEFKHRTIHLAERFNEPYETINNRNKIPTFLEDYQQFQEYITTIINRTLLSSQLPIKSYSYQALVSLYLSTEIFNVYMTNNETKSYKSDNLASVALTIVSIPENNMPTLISALENETEVLPNSTLPDKSIVNEMVAIISKNIFENPRPTHPFFKEFSSFSMPLTIEVNTTLPYEENTNETQGLYNLTLSGAYIFSNSRRLLEFTQKYLFSLGGLYEEFLLVQYLPNIFPLLKAFINYGLRFRYSVELGLQWEWDLNQLRKMNPKKFSQRYGEMIQKMNIYDQYHQGIPIDVYIGGEEFTGLSSAINTYVFGATVIFFIVGLPIFILCLFVTNYTFNLFYRKKQQQIATLKSRGSTWYQVFAFQLFESLVLGFVAIVVASFVSIPFALLSLRTDGILLFGKPRTSMVFPDQNFYLNMFLFGFLVGFLLNIPIIRRLLKLKPTAHDTVEIDYPFWKRKYIDIALVVFGIIGLFFISNLRLYSSFLAFNPLLFLIMFLFIIFTPFILLIGLILFLNRSYRFIIPQIAKLAFNHFDGVIPLALNNLKINFPLTRRTILVLTVTMTLGLILILFPILLFYNTDISAHYFVGSDISVYKNPRPILHNLTLPQNEVEQLQQTVKSINPALRTTFIKIVTLFDMKFMVVNTSTFLDAAFIHPLSNFPRTKGRLQKLLLEENTTLFFSKSLKKNFYQVGETITKSAPVYVYNSDSNEMELLTTINFTLKITGTFNFLSKLVDSRLYYSFSPESSDNADYYQYFGPSYSHVFVISEETYEKYIQPQLATVDVLLSNATKNSSILDVIFSEYGVLYVKIPSSFSVKEIEKQIAVTIEDAGFEDWYTESILDYGFVFRKAPPPIDPTSISHLYELVSYAGTLSVYIIFNSFILATFLVSLIVFLIFGILYFNEHNREFAVERVLGLKRKQIFVQGAAAILTLYIFSFPISLILGSTLIYVVLWSYLSGIRVFPPLNFMHYPVMDVVTYSFVVSVIVIISILVATGINSKKNIIYILKNE